MKMKLFYCFVTLIWCFSKVGVFSVEAERVSVMDGDSVTLHTGVKTHQHEKILWYFNNTRIALINKDLSMTCTDVQCNTDTERFRDRLKLDRQTGSLTILNIRTTDDTGDYLLLIIRYSSTNEENIEKTFSFAADTSEMTSQSVKEGESVTLGPVVFRNTNNEMTWHFKDILIAQLTGNQSQICTNAECKERFTDRLKHENDSLSITNSRSTDSGEYKLMINSSRFSIIRSFRVNVTTTAPTEEKHYVIYFVLAAVAMFAAVTAGILCYRHHNSPRQNETQMAEEVIKMNDLQSVALNPEQKATANGTSSNQDNIYLLSATNGNGLATNGTPQ